MRMSGRVDVGGEGPKELCSGRCERLIAVFVWRVSYSSERALEFSNYCPATSITLGYYSTDGSIVHRSRG